MTINEPDAEDGQQEPNPAAYGIGDTGDVPIGADRQLPECSGSPAVPDLSSFDREADAEHESAVYLVPTIDDEDALEALGYRAQLAGASAAVEHAAEMLRTEAKPVLVTVGAVPLATARAIQSAVPRTTVRTLRDVASAAAALGYAGSVGFRDPDKDKLQRTWLTIARDARLDLPGDDSEPIDLPSTSASERWPEPMGQAVRVGLLGRFLDLIEPQTEADPAAIALDFLTRFGNAVGRGPHFTVSGDRHGCNLFAAVVGPTGQGRKGSSAAYPRRLFEMADQAWAARCCTNGLSSGEGIIWAVRDPADTGKTNKDGQPVIDHGAVDKRLFVLETELARTLRAAARRDSTLAPILRQAWEGGRLATMTKVPYAATDVHFSLLAHVTGHEFKSLLHDNDVHGGTVNRILFVASRRQRELPFGGDVDELAFAGIGAELQGCLAAARDRGEVGFTDLARECWPGVYGRLQKDAQAPGIGGALLARAVAQVRRLAMLFALVEGAGAVDVQHLGAAVEVWRYSKDTVRYVFGSTTGNRVADRILGELRGTPEGMDRKDIHKLFHGHVPADEINAALALLQELGLAHGRRIPTGGRPRETWTAIRTANE